MITIEDFSKVEVKIGTVVSAERVPETDKLLRLMVDLGEEEPRQIDLPFGVEVPLPAFENKITLNNSVTENSLCFPGGTKRIKETTYPDGKRHYEVRIDPADISVCSKKDPNVIPETLPESNWVVDLNHADSAVMAAMGIETERARKDQKLEDEMRHIGELASQALVDKNCGSQVFL